MPLDGGAFRKATKELFRDISFWWKSPSLSSQDLTVMCSFQSNYWFFVAAMRPERLEGRSLLFFSLFKFCRILEGGSIPVSLPLLPPKALATFTPSWFKLIWRKWKGWGDEDERRSYNHEFSGERRGGGGGGGGGGSRSLSLLFMPPPIP